MFDFIRWKVFCPVRVSFEEFCMFVFFDQKNPNWIYVNMSFLFLLIIRMLQQKLHKKTHLYPIQERNKLHQLQRNLPEKKKKVRRKKTKCMYQRKLSMIRSQSYFKTIWDSYQHCTLVKQIPASAPGNIQSFWTSQSEKQYRPRGALQKSVWIFLGYIWVIEGVFSMPWCVWRSFIIQSLNIDI